MQESATSNVEAQAAKRVMCFTELSTKALGSFAIGFSSLLWLAIWLVL